MAIERSPARRRLAACLALTFALAITPGCLTNAVWTHLGAQEWQREVISEQRVCKAVKVHIEQRQGTMLLLDAGGNGSGIADQRIRPRMHGHTGAELLVRPELFQVASAKLRGTVSTFAAGSKLAGTHDTNQANLIITGSVAPGAWRTLIAPDQIPAAVRQALQADRPPASAGLPEGLRRCANWLRWPKTNDLLPELGADAKLITFVFVDRNNEAPCKPDLTQSTRGHAATYPECREELRASTLYVRFRSRTGTQYVRIEPDAFYIVFGLESDRGDPGVRTHRSRWRFEPLDRQPGLDPQSGIGHSAHATLAATIWRGEVAAAMTPWPVRVAQVALTPLTLAADVIYTPAAYLVGLYVW